MRGCGVCDGCGSKECRKVVDGLDGFSRVRGHRF
jgi:hypothetical protein